MLIEKKRFFFPNTNIHINIYAIKFSKNKEQEAEQERGQAFYIVCVSNLMTVHWKYLR